MLSFTTSPVIIGDGAALAARKYISENFGGVKNILAVCDANTEVFAAEEFPGAERYVFAADEADGVAVVADPALCAALAARAAKKRALVACGAGTVHDLTRYTAHGLDMPFISFPTAPSVDGFVSGIAAMTVNGQKLSFPSSPPAALFAQPGVFMTAPPALTASGVGDIMGKYISLCDWKISSVVTGERWDDEIAALESSAVEKLMTSDPGSREFGMLLMEALVTSGLAIQVYGTSRPASGAEHHLSHLWEMHCINPPTTALHGEKVGVATLLLLDRYRSAKDFRLAERFYTREYLAPVFGALTDGIINENPPQSRAGGYPFIGLSQKRLNPFIPAIREAVNALPDPALIRDFMTACSCKTDIASLGLPDTPEFLRLSLEFAPYVRRRCTLLRLCTLN